MGNFNKAVFTAKGLALNTKVQASRSKINFSKISTGDGVWNVSELGNATALRSPRQSFTDKTVTIPEASTVKIAFKIVNTNLNTEYNIKEVGLFAMDPDEGEILYAIASAKENQWDFVPDSSEPISYPYEFYIGVSNAADIILVTPESDLDEHVIKSVFDDGGIHGLKYDYDDETLKGYNPRTGEWEAVGGGGAGAQLMVTAPEGSEVSVYLGDKLVGTQIGGICTFNIRNYGTYRIHATNGYGEDEKDGIVIDTTKLYSETLTYWTATLRLNSDKEIANFVVSPSGKVQKTHNWIESNRYYEFNIYETGTYTFTGSYTETGNNNPVWNVSKIIEIQEESAHSDTIEFPRAEVNVTFPEGATCTMTQGDIVYTATANPYLFVLPSMGNWEAKITDGTQTATQNVFVEDTDSKSITMNYFMAAIAVTYPEGATCTLEKFGQVVGSATTNPYEFIVVSTGEYTVKASLGSEYAEQTVTISSDGQRQEVSLMFTVAFAYHYSENDSNPDSVTYPEGYANSGWTPMYVNLSTGAPVYGSWDPNGANAKLVKWLFPRSCMLKYDGTVDYYLDENDETKKEDGTPSDVANVDYGGNAMMEWGQDGKKIYWKQIPDADGKGWTFVVANGDMGDPDMKPWNHYNCNGQVASHFYTPKYFGSYDNTRLRSISGRTNMVSQNASTELTRAKANNLTSDEIWNTEVWCDRQLFQHLTTLLSRSLNSQSKFGYGYANANLSPINPGTMNKKGLFYGESTGKQGVKVFGMEHPWGSTWRRTAGLINDKGTIKAKLTYGTQDGSTVNGYNLNGAGYVSCGSVAGISGGYISAMNISNKFLVPKTISGSDTTFYSDGSWFENNQVNYALVGGDHNLALPAGSFCVRLSHDVSRARTGDGVALSCKPLV